MTRGALRFATYNIHGAVGIDRRRDVDRIARVLGQLDADVIALQEVETRPSRGANQQARHLAMRLGMCCVEGPLLYEPGGWYGNAILLRWPARRVRRLRYPGHGREPRGALEVGFEDGGGRPWRVLGTHLDLQPRWRERQAETLAALLAGDDWTPALALGDLNEWRPWSRALHALCRVGDLLPARASFPGFCPLLPLDRMVLRGCYARSAPRRHGSPLSRIASDHLPVCASVCAD